MKKYNIIYADPPWQYKDKGCKGAAEHHYNTMTIQDICNLPIKEISADNCVLFLWATYPMLKEMFMVMDAWGFEYKTIGFQWVKQSTTRNKLAFGLGRWTRSNSEPCFIGVKGKPKPIVNNIPQVVMTPITKHSEKPNYVRDKIVKLMGDIPRVELFARKKFEGWDSWGNEIECDLNLEVIHDNNR